MIEFIVIAEFHETEGSKIVLKYPSSAVTPTSIESYILSEGLHKFQQDSSLLIFRQKKLFTTKEEHPKFKQLCSKQHMIDLYTFSDNAWKMISPESATGCVLKIHEELDGGLFMLICFNNTEISKIEIHKDIQFTVIDSNFASLYSVSGEAFGLFFRSNSQYDLESLLTFSLEDNIDPTEQKLLQTETIYCLTYSSIKKSSDFPRGAKIMGAAIGSRSKHIACLNGVLAVALDEIMVSESLEKIAAKFVKSCSNASWPSAIITEDEKKVLKWCEDKGYYKNSLSHCVKIRYNKTDMFAELDKCLLEEEMPSTLLRLYDVFKGNIMKIYAGLIEEKRVVLYSANKSCWDICGYVFAVGRLISPPVPYLLSFHIYPFVHLNDLDFLSNSFFIAGANNPLFKHRAQWWDIFADLDTGEVITSAPLNKFYKEFIDNLALSLVNEDRKELVIRSQFFDFTQHIIDYSLFNNEFEKFSCKMPTPKLENSLILKYYSMKYYKEVNFDKEAVEQDLYLNLLRLRFMHITGETAGIHIAYKGIYKSIRNKGDCLRLLAIMPNSGDLHCISWGFFSENTAAWKYACKILMKIEASPEGRFLVSVLPTSELNAYIAYKNRF